MKKKPDQKQVKGLARKLSRIWSKAQYQVEQENAPIEAWQEVANYILQNYHPKVRGEVVVEKTCGSNHSWDEKDRRATIYYTELPKRFVNKQVEIIVRRVKK